MRAKDDCNRLLNSAVPFAEKMLNEHREFLPFGAKMLVDGEIVSVGAYSGEEHPPSKDLIDILQDAFKSDAGYDTLLATAMVYDVWVTSPGSDQKSDAIAVDLDHRDNYSVKVFFPYTTSDMEIILGEPFGSIGDYAIFPSPNPLHA